MKRFFRQALLAIGFALLFTQTFSQIVDYSTWTPPSPLPCNLFAEQRMINSIAHKSSAGQPMYDANKKKVYLSCKYENGKTYGSEYFMNVTFKQFYNYTVKAFITTYKGVNNTGIPYLRLRLLNGGSNTPQCNGAEEINSDMSGNNRNIMLATGGDEEVSLNFTNVDGNYSYMYVGAITTSTNGENGVYIKNIQISETGKSEFSFPAPNVDCATSQATFSVENPKSVGPVTQYVWNLGATNGWMYQGAPAQASITTTTNSIALSLPCGGSPTPVSVTVYVNGAVWNTYTTNAVVCANPAPSLTITGSDVVCAGSANYTLSGAPAGSSITWSVSNPYVALLCNSNTPTVTVSKAAGYNEKINLTATATCGGTYRASMNIDLGTPNFGHIQFTNAVGGQGYWCSSHYGNEFTVDTPASNTTYEMRLRTWPDYNLVYTDPNIHSYVGVFGYPAKPGWYVLEIRGTNSCGSGDWVGYEVEYVDCTQSGGGEEYFAIEASPNPASNEINVRTTNERPEVKVLGKSETVHIILTDFNTMKPVKQWKFENNQSSYSLNVGRLKRGRYVLQVLIGKYRQSKHIVLQ